MMGFHLFIQDYDEGDAGMSINCCSPDHPISGFLGFFSYWG